MAVIYPGELRIQQRHFGFYQQPIGGHVLITVRRKIGEPCDTLHPSSKAVRLQRLRLAAASKDWSNLSYAHKNYWHRKYGWI